jgi:hypothetical protein
MKRRKILFAGVIFTVLVLVTAGSLIKHVSWNFGCGPANKTYAVFVQLRPITGFWYLSFMHQPTASYVCLYRNHKNLPYAVGIQWEDRTPIFQKAR